jgi:hypothetical protein
MKAGGVFWNTRCVGHYAYIGTFESPCGDGTGDNGSGIRIFDVLSPAHPVEVAHVPSVQGSRTNDVKLARFNTPAFTGDLLVHSNESCNDGPGGFELYDVTDPTHAVHLAHVQTDDINPVPREHEDFKIVDVGVHNLFLFTQGDKAYVAAVVESRFGNFQVFEITDPTSPALVGFWGAEELAFPEVDFTTLADTDLINEVTQHLSSGLGSSESRYLDERLKYLSRAGV